MFEGSVQGVSRMFEEVLRVFTKSFKKCKGWFKQASRLFQGSFNEVLFCNFVLALISSQLPEQKEGLFKTSLEFS